MMEESVDTSETQVPSSTEFDDFGANLSYAEINEAAEKSMKQRDLLLMENILLHDYLTMLMAKEQQTQLQQVVPIPAAAPVLSTTDMSRTSPPSSSRSKLRHARGSLSPAFSDTVAAFLTIGQKCEIVAKEVEALREKLQALHDHSQYIITQYRVKLEESELRQADLKRAMAEFNKEVLIGGINANTGKIMSEKLMKYFEHSFKNKDMTTERYRLNNSTLKSLVKKLHTQLKQKEEMGDSLREVDYNQLKIENAQYQEKVEERNQAMLKVKFLMSLTMQLLGQQKVKLQQLIQQSSHLTEEIDQRENYLSKIESEMLDAMQDKEKINLQVKRLKEQLENFRVPDVMEYIEKQADVYELKKDVAIWQRKVDVTKKSLRIQKSKSKQNENVDDLHEKFYD